MNIFKSLILTAVASVVISCITPSPVVSPQPTPAAPKPAVNTTPRPVTTNTYNRDRDRDRESYRRTETRSNSRICEDDDDCEDKCSDLFRSRTLRKECEKLTVSEVDSLEEIIDVFEDPDEEDLEDVDVSVLEIFLEEFNSKAVDLAEDLSARDSETMLEWIAKNEDVAESFNKNDDDKHRFEVFTALLKNVNTNINEALNDRNGFLDIALDEGTAEALELVHNLFYEDEVYTGERKCTGTRIERDKCVFTKHYCALSLDKDQEDAYLDDYEFFVELADDILTDQLSSRNNDAASWWTKDTEADELQNWKSGDHNMCKALGVR